MLGGIEIVTSLGAAKFGAKVSNPQGSGRGLAVWGCCYAGLGLGWLSCWAGGPEEPGLASEFMVLRSFKVNKSTQVLFI